MKHIVLIISLTASLAIGCGSHHSNTTGDDAGGGGDDGPGPTADAATPAGCTQVDLSKPQCSNCKDDDGDGRIDSYDINCTGPLDNDEATFKTGLPGDNVDPVHQDCFFDGNSGAGNDGCNIHVCCLLGATKIADCPIGANRYDPKQCPPPIGTGSIDQKCIDHCGKITPPGCDCFGCCTVCDPTTNACFDIVINPADSVGCGPTTLSDPTKCLRCTKNTMCGSPTCGGQTCILCPGQDPSDLPSTCNGMNMCPADQQSCVNDMSCPTGGYCASGCCVPVIF